MTEKGMAIHPGSCFLWGVAWYWYYRDRPDLTPEERAQLNFDHPDALEADLLVEHLSAL